ncbi:ribosomal RNA processing protein 36 homolog [Aplysia californica]|uniref:rRNA biogenesis protein RRP36 n=1 Tax=Aplysia californica TaxID=6500 RepID=A0ABM0K1Y0_APLCA|nr:ribosomal RNA processing protein 36 homolog [Aplysia californica]
MLKYAAQRTNVYFRWIWAQDSGQWLFSTLVVLLCKQNGVDLGDSVWTVSPPNTNENMEQLREEMSHLPLSELKEMQEKLGLKAFNKLKHGLALGKQSGDQVFKRENKNRPTEVSARRAVPQKVSAPKEKTKRDPRFDDLSGEYNEKIFKNTYGFIADVKSKEKLKLKRIIKKTKDKDKKSEMKQLLNRMEQQELAEKKKARREELEKEWKKKEKERVKEGKKPYFMKKAEKRALEEEEYKKELEKSGKMQKYLTRKTKKIAMKEKKKQSWTTKDV